MERKNFIRSLSLLAASSPLLVNGCKKDSSLTEETNTGASDVPVSTSCKVTPQETEGPFPTKSPASYIRRDIRKGDGLGVDMQTNISIVNTNNSCNPLSDAIVDIWHCDVKGDYSEYGGTQMQSANYQNQHWFRGRQITDVNGLVTFQTIFPGWYQGRATHIHVHVYNSSGKSLLVTQIAFQDSLSVSVNTNGSNYGYTKGISGYTYNAKDNVFSDGVDQEMSTVTGTLSEGMQLAITIRVSA
ncbi:intradiol ring-cleavage dioxygenase [Sphingobacterium spiritivorum]|uniref:dioxygenase family protein n=1 Tax=Sphingobacterium spiritivorum TaxID=258 RepID=UPI001918BA04|nr:intradiol ring-cleavage dioxygenase [Sphingobacterium spiritivorum]QQT26044.1 intradiol ring-cleavage dioxygenase [Sphingobacterium spiritivorum]